MDHRPGAGLAMLKQRHQFPNMFFSQREETYVKHTRGESIRLEWEELATLMIDDLIKENTEKTGEK